MSTQAMDQAYIKRHNSERLLEALERFQPVSRTDLSRITEMSSASVTRIVGALMSLGLVEAVSRSGGAGRGRKAVNLSTHPDGLLALGCHADPRSLRMYLMDFSNRQRSAREIPLTPDDLLPERLAELAAGAAAELAADERIAPACAGVSLSGRVDGGTGRIARSEAFDWTDADLAGPMSRALGLPVHVENDVRACLIWERLRRNLSENEDAAYVYIGRAGVGFASTVNGLLVRGRSNGAGEIEDVTLGLRERLGEHLMEESLLKRARTIAPAASSMEDVLTAYRLDLPWARALLDDFQGHLGILLNLVEALLEPHCVILGGDIPDALSAVPGLLPEGCVLGERYEDSCACGAAVIAMREAVHRMLEGELDG